MLIQDLCFPMYLVKVPGFLYSACLFHVRVRFRVLYKQIAASSVTTQKISKIFSPKFFFAKFRFQLRLDLAMV
jgi:hypothetical protein